MATSTIPALFDKLKSDCVAAMADNPDLTKVVVLSAPLGPKEPAPEGLLVFTGVPEPVDESKVTLAGDELEIGVAGVVQVTAKGGGEDKAIEARNRAFDILAELEAVVRVPDFLGTGATSVRLGPHSFQQSADDNGRTVQIPFTVIATSLI